MYLYFGGRGEVTLARRSSLEGVHGGVDVGCRVAKGIFEGPGRVPCLESVAEPLYVSIRIFPSMYGRRVVHLRSVSDGVCGAILWVMVVERGGGSWQVRAAKIPRYFLCTTPVHLGFTRHFPRLAFVFPRESRFGRHVSVGDLLVIPRGRIRGGRVGY